jgi:carbonic anhydrase
MLIFLLAFTYVAPFALYSESDQNSNFWNALRRGNEKFVRSPKYKKQRAPLVEEQHPRAVVLGCIDSRVTPEILFSQKLGKLAVARVAGQVVDDVVEDSIEFIVRRYRTPLIVVLGHQNCGAVRGALDRLIANGGQIDPVIGHRNAVLASIEIAIKTAGINIYAPDAFEQSIRANVAYQANQLIARSAIIADKIARKELKIIGAEYFLKSGKVKQLFVIE